MTSVPSPKDMRQWMRTTEKRLSHLDRRRPNTGSRNRGLPRTTFTNNNSPDITGNVSSNVTYASILVQAATYPRLMTALTQVNGTPSGGNYSGVLLLGYDTGSFSPTTQPAQSIGRAGQWSGSGERWEFQVSGQFLLAAGQAITLRGFIITTGGTVSLADSYGTAIQVSGIEIRT